MATKKISEFTTLGSLSDNDILPVVSGGANKKVTASVLKTYAQAGGGTSLPTDAQGFLQNDGSGTLSWASAPASLISPDGTYEVTLDDTGALVLSSYGVVKNPDHVNMVSDGWVQMQWVDTETLTNADPNSTSGPTNWIYVDQGGIHVETNINSNIGDSTSRYDWLFDIYGNLTMPVGGDIKDSNGNSVLGGGGGNPFNQSLNTDDIVTFDLLTVTDSVGIKNFYGQRITNTYINGTMYVNGSDTQTPVSIMVAGAGPRNEWAFTPDGLLTFPRNQDQVTTTDPILTIEGGTNPKIASTNSDSTGPADLDIQANNLNISGYNGNKVIIHGDDGSITADNNLVLKSNNTGSAFEWTFDNTGNLTLPAGGDIKDSNGVSVLGGGASTGDITFDGVKVIGAETNRGGGSIELVPNNGYYGDGQYLNIYPTNAQDAPHIHLAAGTNGDLILGDDNSHVDVNHNGYVRIRSYDSGTSNSYQWRFHYDGNLQLPGAGAIEHSGSYTRTTASWFQGADASGVVWTALQDLVGSVKLTIQTQSPEVGDSSGSHFQTCEAIIASRGVAASGYGVGEPVMTVYGVTHTSTAPLATFSVQRNATTKLIEIVATRTAATDSGIDFRIHSVEMIAID